MSSGEASCRSAKHEHEHEHEAEQLRVKSGDSREHMRQDSMTCRRAFLQHVSFTVINTSDCRDRDPAT